jgi:hypothetical protein
MKPTLIVYGSCQAQEIAALARTIPAINLQYEVVYLVSFSVDGVTQPRLHEKEVKACRLLWEQFDNSNPFPHHDVLPASAQQVMFPGIDMNCLWPFNTRDPLNAPEPSLPFGRFPYGDRLVIELMDQGLSERDVIAGYDEAAGRVESQLQRLLAIDSARHAQREAKCAVSISDRLVGDLHKARPLWTNNHPTLDVLRVLFERICAATWDDRIKPWEIVGSAYADPFTYLQMPIHGVVAEALSLSWWNPNMEYALPGFGRLTFEEYIAAYTSWRFTQLAMASN